MIPITLCDTIRGIYMELERLHALDTVRAAALLLGIVLHATMSFRPAFSAWEWWPIVDTSPSTTLGVTFSVIHMFRMTVFFLMAGFFARLLLERKGAREFLRDRRRRILLPLIISWPIVCGLVMGVMAWALFKTGRPILGPRPPPEPVFLPFMWFHLWFLYVLLWLYAILLLTRFIANHAIDRTREVRNRIDLTLRGITSLPIAPLVLAIPLAVCLQLAPGWFPWEGIPAPDKSFVPNLPALAGYGTAFFFGWFVHRQIKLLQAFEYHSTLYLLVSILLTALCFNLGGSRALELPIKLGGGERAIYVICYAVATWTWTLGLTGLANRFLTRERRSLRYLADASYWVYILHLPVVFGLQVLVMDWPLHWSAKFPLIVVTALALLLLSYHYLVRSTAIGQLLNGKRYPRNVAHATSQDAGTGVTS